MKPLLVDSSEQTADSARRLVRRPAVAAL